VKTKVKHNLTLLFNALSTEQNDHIEIATVLKHERKVGRQQLELSRNRQAIQELCSLSFLVKA